MSGPIAFTYEADHHCPRCTVARFGPDCEGTDGEGNPVGALFPWDEWHEPSEPLPQVLACGTCGDEIDRVDED